MSNIEFKYEGIGDLIARGRLRVPPNQRDYAWEEENVAALCDDVFDAILNKKQTYFLGTVVLTKAKDGFLEVVDGQQRLATTTMLFGVIRDMFYGLEEPRLVTSIESDYLFGFDIKSEEDAPKLQLNTRDHEFYFKHILASPAARKSLKKLTYSASSINRLQNAATVIRSHLEAITKAYNPASQRVYLKDLIDFLKENANLIVLTVNDDVNAYVMFETLNDRGLRVSQADLVKNFLFGQAGNRLSEAQDKWTSMLRSLETVNKEDSAIDYLRLLSSVMNGLTRERQVFEKIRAQTGSPLKAITFLKTADEFSVDYVAMLTPEHWKWNEYNPSIRESISTLNLFGVTQIRHLMLAVSHHFSKSETEKTFRLFVDWIVRLFIAGSGRIGRVEAIYASLAHAIHNQNDPKTARFLADRMSPNIASDRDFEKAFAIAHVSKSNLARYYLDALEKERNGAKLPELVTNKDVNAVNLEHIMPVNMLKHAGASAEDGSAYINRIGNLTLLNSRVNASIGQLNFTSKRPKFAESAFQLTKDIAAFETWGPAEIDIRQERLAALAVKTWSAKIA